MNNLLTRWMKRYKYYGLTLLCIVLLIGLSTLMPTSRAQAYTEKARSADAFVDSIGVATHLRYTDTAYGRYDDVIKPRLQELGVRHIRDGGKDDTLFKRLNDLAKSGIKATLVMDPRDGITPSNMVNEVIKPVRSAIEAAEGPNEWDVQSQLNYQGQSFPNGVRKYQSEMYSAINSDPSTASIAVLMPSLAFPSNSSRLGRLSSLDSGNMHSYAGGNIPSQDLDSKWIPSTQIVSGSDKPITATECGWHNAVNDTKASQPGISEKTAGKYVPRLYLEYFNRGVKRTFLYELINERQADNQENNFGLLRYDGSPKPAFTSVKNLIALLKDPGDSFEPKTLTYSLSGNLDNVHHTLLQKRDGTFYMILWQESPGFDLNNKRDLALSNQLVTLKINAPMRQATAYYPISSTSSIWTRVKPTSLQVNVPDHPLVIALEPAS
jgi:hypothetical protein